MTKSNIALGKQIKHWLHCNFMVATNEQVTAACDAWHSCQVADRPDNNNESCQLAHRDTLRKMHAAFAVAP